MNPALEAIRRRIEHEDDLISQRLSWLVGSQAFLLSAFAISLNAPPAFVRPGYAAANHLLTSFIPCGVVGIIVVLWLTLIGAIWSLRILRTQAMRITTSEELPIYSSRPIRLLGLAAPLLIPLILLALWIPLLPCGL